MDLTIERILMKPPYVRDLGGPGGGGGGGGGGRLLWAF